MCDSEIAKGRDLKKLVSRHVRKIQLKQKKNKIEKLQLNSRIVFEKVKVFIE